MNKFSKVTGLIAFWTRVAVFLGTIFIVVFQKTILNIFHAPELDVTVFPFDEIFIRFVLLLITGLFFYGKKTDNRERAIISLYFYLFVTILFSNPIVSSVSFMLEGMKGTGYIAAKSIISSAIQSILYIFTLAANVCFYLSAGTLIVLNDNGNQNKEIQTDVSEKSRTKLILFSGFLGVFGIDRFYAKRTVSGLVKLLLGLPVIITVIRILLSLVSNGFSDSLISIFMFFSYAFAVNPSDSILCPFLLALIPYLPVMVFSIIDFVLCVLGRMRDSEKKLIAKW